LRGTNSQYNKATNLRLILQVINKQPAISRIEIAKQTALTKQTISNLTDILDKAGLIKTLGISKSGVGKPSTLISLNSEGAYTLGVRVRVNSIEVGLYSITGELLDYLHNHIETLTPANISDLIASICTEQLQANAVDPSRVLGVGLLLPSTHRFNQSQRHTEHINRLQDDQISKDIQQQLETKMQLPVILENLAGAVALKETFFGAAKELKSFIYLYLGYSIDASFVIDNKLLVGFQGFTGRLGHLIVDAQGRECPCGNDGCLNQYASLSALEKHIEKHTRQAVELTHIIDNPQRYENLLKDWFDDMSEPMRIALNSLENLFNAETIIMGGDVPDWFLDRFIRSLRPFLPSIAQFNKRELPRLIRAPTEEHNAIKGAATLPIYFALNQQRVPNNNSETTAVSEEHLVLSSPAERLNAIIFDQ